MKKILTTRQTEDYKNKIRNFSNKGKYKKAYNLSLKLHKKYPENLTFAYLEALFAAEEQVGYTDSQIEARYSIAASKLKVLLFKLRSVDPNLRNAIRNEYYWFSKQPYKQYKFGVERVRYGEKRVYYAQGVGAVEVAKQFAKNGKFNYCLKWARISENAWLQYFKVQRRWFNSYLFYGMALGILGKIKEMKNAFRIGAKISGLPVKSEIFKSYEKQVYEILNFSRIGKPI